MLPWLGLLAHAGSDPDEPFDILELSLEDLLDVETTTATKTESTARQAPAIVTVIQGDEIRAAGYTSVAEVLQTVPGFHDLYDRVSHNFGVRGVNGGAQASGSILQVRIDDQAVPLHTTTGNLFGPELVPIEAIERIEILRGPGSALYGANAFLGVVRIVTRSGASVDNGELTGQLGWVSRSPAGGLGLVLGGAGDDVDVFVSAHGMRSDRSGDALPETSPILATVPSLADEVTTGDRSQPLSLLAHASTGREDLTGRFTIWTSVQQLDTAGELLSVAPMTHGSHVSIRNQHHRLSWHLHPTEDVSIEAWGNAFDTRPTEAEVLDLGVEDQRWLPLTSATGGEVGVETQLQLAPALALTAGAEARREHHVVPSYNILLLEDVLTAEGQILRPAGTQLPGAGSGEEVVMAQEAGYAQLEARIGAAVHTTAGARIDHHSVYGLQLNPRLGLVVAPDEAMWSLKLLYGSSFKAPSVQQLFGYPLLDYDIRGNPDLEAQRAHTAEIGGTLDLGPGGALFGDVFVTTIDGRVEYLQDGLWLYARNALFEVDVGGEVEGTLRIVDGLRLWVGLGVARSVVQTQAEGVFGPDSYPAPYPHWKATLSPAYTHRGLGLRVEPELLLIGARSASQPNTLEVGSPYELPPSAQLALAVGLPQVYVFGSVPTSVVVRGTDLLDARPTEPGFGGIDYPGIGRTVWLTVRQGL